MCYDKNQVKKYKNAIQTNFAFNLEEHKEIRKGCKSCKVLKFKMLIQFVLRVAVKILTLRSRKYSKGLLYFAQWQIETENLTAFSAVTPKKRRAGSL